MRALINAYNLYERYRSFFWFLCSGTLAFLIDFLILWALSSYGLSLWIARALSFLAAASFTWLFNSNISFKNRDARFRGYMGWCIYIGLALIGGTLNYIVSMIVLLYFSPASPLVMFCSIAAGSLAGLLVNYSINHFWFFKH